MTEKTYRFPAHFNRFCEARGCCVCPIDPCERSICYDPEKVEEIIIAWVAENPEPKPVAWTEWWLEMFPDMKEFPCPKCFGIHPPCTGVMCSDCWKTTIVPDDVVKAFESVPRPVRARKEEKED